MSPSDALEVLANIAAVVTASVALFAYLTYRFQQRSRRIRLEEHLKEEKERGWDGGQRTVTHLMANLGMTEAEVLHAAFQSRIVRSAVKTDEDGLASTLLFEHDSDDVGSWGRTRPL